MRTTPGATAILATLVLACARSSPPPPPPLETERPIVLPPRQADGALTRAERDSLLRDATTRRATWRARRLSDYDLVVAVGCFCPWPSYPAIIEVRHGTITALRDTLGKSLGAVREPWSLYSVEGLFDAVEQGIQRDDVIRVAYDPTYATRLTPRQR